MLRGETDGLNWQSPDRGLRGQLFQDCIQQSIGKQRIGGEWQMRTVLFTGAEGPDKRGSIDRNGLLHLRPAQLIETTASGIQRHA